MSSFNIWPVLRCLDSRILFDFLISAFGFVEGFVVLADDSIGIVHAEILWPEGGGVMMGDAVIGDAVHLSLPSGPVSIYIITAQPHVLYQRAVKAGALIVKELQHEEYGSHGFSAADPEGNIWSFGTYSGA